MKITGMQHVVWRVSVSSSIFCVFKITYKILIYKIPALKRLRRLTPIIYLRKGNHIVKWMGLHVLRYTHVTLQRPFHTAPTPLPSPS